MEQPPPAEAEKFSQMVFKAAGMPLSESSESSLPAHVSERRHLVEITLHPAHPLTAFIIRLTEDQGVDWLTLAGHYGAGMISQNLDEKDIWRALAWLLARNGGRSLDIGADVPILGIVVKINERDVTERIRITRDKGVEVVMAQLSQLRNISGAMQEVYTPCVQLARLVILNEQPIPTNQPNMVELFSNAPLVCSEKETWAHFVKACAFVVRNKRRDMLSLMLVISHFLQFLPDITPAFRLS
jgi:hypothetical protein